MRSGTDWYLQTLRFIRGTSRSIAYEPLINCELDMRYRQGDRNGPLPIAMAVLMKGSCFQDSSLARASSSHPSCLQITSTSKGSILIFCVSQRIQKRPYPKSKKALSSWQSRLHAREMKEQSETMNEINFGMQAIFKTQTESRGLAPGLTNHKFATGATTNLRTSQSNSSKPRNLRWTKES